MDTVKFNTAIELKNRVGRVTGNRIFVLVLMRDKTLDPLYTYSRMYVSRL